MASQALSLILALMFLFEDNGETSTALRHSTQNSSLSGDHFETSTIHPKVNFSDSLLRTIGRTEMPSTGEHHYRDFNTASPTTFRLTNVTLSNATDRKDATTVHLASTTGGEHVTTIPPRTTIGRSRVTTEGRGPTTDSTTYTDISPRKYTGYTGREWITARVTTEGGDPTPDISSTINTDSTRYTSYTGGRWTNSVSPTEQTDSTRYTGYTGGRWTNSVSSTEQTDSTWYTGDPDSWWTTSKEERLCNTSPGRGRFTTPRYPTSTLRTTHSTEDTRFPWQWFTTPRYHVSTSPPREEPTPKPDSGSKSIPGSLRNYFIITCSDCNVFSNINAQEDRKKRDDYREQMKLHSMLQELETMLQQIEEDVNDTNEFLLPAGISSQNT